jgi:phosphopantothenoylcysteine decarboxylase/phosphopantothenate--cysteine ligase
LSRILITSGPTRQYLDPVRYLTNASSGRMGSALAEAALALGHEVVVVSGPVEVAYPAAAEVVPVVTTEEMLAAATDQFTTCDGLIGAAAPCDYRPEIVETHKISKSGREIDLHLVETEDILATLGTRKGRRWVVGFALETAEHRQRALLKLRRKHCDLIVSNGPQSLGSADSQVEVLASGGQVVAALAGTKQEVAAGILAIIHERLILPRE